MTGGHSGTSASAIVAFWGNSNLTDGASFKVNTGGYLYGLSSGQAISGAGNFAQASSSLPFGVATYGNSTTAVDLMTAGMYFAGGTFANYIGFRFVADSDQDLHYGWAELEIHLDGANSYWEIKDGYYNDTAHEGITVGAVPEPDMATLGIGALALGYTGMHAYRRRRKQAAKAQA